MAPEMPRAPARHRARRSGTAISVLHALGLVLLFALGTPAVLAHEPSTGVAWSSLSADQQALLDDFAARWDQVPPARQRALARGSQRWLAMTPQQQRAVRENFRNFKELPPQRRRMLRQRWLNATPEQRARMLERARSQQHRHEPRPGSARARPSSPPG